MWLREFESGVNLEKGLVPRVRVGVADIDDLVPIASVCNVVTTESDTWAPTWCIYRSEMAFQTRLRSFRVIDVKKTPMLRTRHLVC